MKRFILLLILSIISLGELAQSQNVTRFLGIPIDGEKAELMRKLKKKGFKTTKFGDAKVLTGKFNGMDVNIDIAVNANDKVYRLVISEKGQSNEGMIHTEFNNLCQQFKENPNYISTTTDYTIPDDEDISYQLSLGKQYQAVFFQKPTEHEDSLIWSEVTARMVLDVLHSDRKANPTLDERTEEVKKLYYKILSDVTLQKRVWFTIFEHPYPEHPAYKYSIVMYYENVYNEDNGEDL